jgi:cyclase
MLRIIARLDIKNRQVIKGIQLEGQRHIGNPVEIARNYYEQGIDEILLMDSVASLYDRNNLFHTVEEACKSVFVPITMGGGIRNISDVEQALKAGADKVAVNTALVRNQTLADEIVSTYGSQCLVGSIEAKKINNSWQAYISNGREPTGKNALEWAKELEQQGIGELLVTSVDMEGTQRGFDIQLYEELEKIISIPIIGCGGAGKIRDFIALEDKTQLQGHAISSVLHYKKTTITEIKNCLDRTSNRRK